jgi:hypothetical protein
MMIKMMVVYVSESREQVIRVHSNRRYLLALDAILGSTLPSVLLPIIMSYIRKYLISVYRYLSSKMMECVGIRG